MSLFTGIRAGVRWNEKIEVNSCCAATTGVRPARSPRGGKLTNPRDPPGPPRSRAAGRTRPGRMSPDAPSVVRGEEQQSRSLWRPAAQSELIAERASCNSSAGPGYRRDPGLLPPANAIADDCLRLTRHSAARSGPAQGGDSLLLG